MSSRLASLTGRSADSRGSASAGRLSASSPPASSLSPSSPSPALIDQLRQRLMNALQSNPKLRELLSVCAESNAWSVEEAKQRPDSITVMELFLLQVHRVPLLPYFPNLVTIKFMNIGLESMADLASLSHVEELWLSDNNISVIEGLQNMTKLRRLFLQGNAITTLAGLPPLRHLRELWVSRNQLRELTHIAPLRKLRALYAAENPIERLAGAFTKEMTHLHDVNLSGCHLSDIAQLCALQLLPCLRNVWFADPLFGDNPICRMNNYTTLVLARLDALDTLDGAYVTPEQRTLVGNVVAKKGCYYEMRAQMLDAHLVLLTRHAEACARREVQEVTLALAQLHACLQPIEAELAERQRYLRPSSGDQPRSEGGSAAGTLSQLVAEDESRPTAPLETPLLESLRHKASRAVGTCEVVEQKTLQRLADAAHAATLEALFLKERLAVELHTAGNVHLESVPAHSDLFTTVSEMMQERFSRWLFEREFGITAVTVTGVRRIVNRGLRVRFDDRVKELHVDLASPQQRSRFVGLFGLVPPSQAGQSAWVQHALLHGVAAAAAAVTGGDAEDSAGAEDALYIPTPPGEGVPLTDSLFYADEGRLRSLGGGSAAGLAAPASPAPRSSSSGAGDATRRRRSSALPQSPSQLSAGVTHADGLLCHGQLVLYRTYLGKSVSVPLGKRQQRDSARGEAGETQTYDSFVRSAGPVFAKDFSEGVTAAYRPLPLATRSSSLSSPSSPRDSQSGGDNSADAAPSTVWYCFDRALVLADCVVDYYYTIPAASPTRRGGQAPSTTIAASGVGPNISADAAQALLEEVCWTTAARPLDVGKDVREDLSSTAAPLLQFIHWCGDGGMVAAPPPRTNGSRPARKSIHSSSSSTTTTTTTNNNSSSCRHDSGGGASSPGSANARETGPAHSSLMSVLGSGSGGHTLKFIAIRETAEVLQQARQLLGDATVTRLLQPSPTLYSAEAAPSSAGQQPVPQPLQPSHVAEYAAKVGVTDTTLSLCVLRGLGLTGLWKDFASPLLSTVTWLDLSQNALTELSWFALAKEAPQLQRLTARGNRLTSLRLDGSKLAELRTLDLSDNDLQRVTDFAALRAAAPALEELDLRGNPLLTSGPRQEAEALLWLYLAHPYPQRSSAGLPVMKLNQRILGGYPGTLDVQRFRRACLLPSSSSDPSHANTRTSSVLAYLTERLGGSRSGATSGEDTSAGAAALFTIDGRTLPGRLVQQTMAQLERWEAEETLDEAIGAAAATAAGDAETAQQQRQQRLQECRELAWCHALLQDTRGLVSLVPNLCRLVLRGHCLTAIDPLLQLTRLESLDVSENHLADLPSLAALKSLRELVVDFNELQALPSELGPLPSLRLLSAAGNAITHVDAALFLPDGAATTADGGSPRGAAGPRLEALHLMHNRIADMNVIYALREISSLLILSVLGNPCTTADEPTRTPGREGDAKAVGEDTRQYLIHVFPQLRALDGGSISPAESIKAREVYAGKISTDLLIERARSQPDGWARVRSLNLSQCTLTEINLLEPFVGLELLQLQHNFIASVTGVATLLRLKALDLSHNRIGAAAWRSANGAGQGGTAASTAGSGSTSPPPQAAPYVALGDALAPLKLLESLSLESNQLTDLGVLKLRLPKLKFLNARGNDLQYLQRGLEHLPDLRELLLDQNKLRGFSTDCFACTKKLLILSAENNAIKSLDGLRGCSKLEQLRLGANRLGELRATLNDLQSCPLRSLVLIGNPVARKSNYRNTTITFFTQLMELDRRAISAEERERAATARVTEYVAPPNVVIDMDFLNAVGTPPGVSLHLSNISASVLGGGGSSNGAAAAMAAVTAAGGVSGAALPSRSRLSNPSAVAPAAAARRGGGGTGAADRFNVNARSRPYRR